MSSLFVAFPDRNMYSLPEKLCHEFFSRYGRCRLNMKQGYIFVDFDERQPAEDLMANQKRVETVVHGVRIECEFSRKHQRGGGGGG